MPSSISSSNDRLPAGPHGRMWIITIVVLLLLLVGVEWLWRSAGHEPSVVDDKNLWSQHRDDANKPKRLVLLGLSRMQLGFATDVFRERYPDWRVASLIVEGRPPAMTLKHLAEDEDFRGVVLVSLNRAAMFKSDSEGTVDNYGWFGQQSYVDYYEKDWRADKAVIRRLATAIQQRATIVHPKLSVRALVTAGIENKPIRPWYVQTMPDRSRKAHYSKSDMNARRAFMHNIIYEERNSVFPDPEPWLEDAKELAVWARQIEARGGKVFFVHMPDQPYGYMQRDPNQKKNYWDRFAALEGVHAVHFLDEPGLRYRDVDKQIPFDCPDYTHLDYADAVIFTGRLLDVLQQRGFLP